MKVLLFRDNTSRTGTVCLSGNKLLVAGASVLVGLPILLGLASYWAASAIDRSLNPFVDPEYRVAVESRVREQEAQMQQTREYVRQHMDVLGRQIGSLQAQVSRISAVEQRIADASGISLKDFEFDQDPPIGGASGVGVDSEQIDIENAVPEEDLAQRQARYGDFPPFRGCVIGG